ncbi:hypothetical protein BDM02DRAFT_2521591 [Thelephora ganbajun]|uniref:Uncharacterized protein n=1 Tax=Thelephora ganbajun TaxID=370292 RepID=A0ACB6ZEC8_THEGA|nr:hypothetical protein BDM02DRAFT_2521591 [Thelephora ganbajun]
MSDWERFSVCRYFFGHSLPGPAVSLIVLLSVIASRGFGFGFGFGLCGFSQVFRVFDTHEYRYPFRFRP